MRRALVALSLAGSALAQIPDGHYCVSSFGFPRARAGMQAGGVFVVDPRTPGSATAITGLGADLTGISGPSVQQRGGNAIHVASNTTVLVGELGLPGDTIDLHVLTIAGSRAVRDVRIPVGAAGHTPAMINQIAPLPGGDVVIATCGLTATGPLRGSQLGIVSPTRRTVTPIAMTGAPNIEYDAVAVDRAGTTVYFALSTLYSVGIRGGAVRRIAALLGPSSGLAVDGSGNVRAAVLRARNNLVVSIDPSNGRMRTIGQGQANINGLGIERASGFSVYVLNGVSSGHGVFFMDALGRSTRLATNLSGVPAGISVLHDPRAFGPPTPGNRTYRWAADPNPGGVPRLGDASFALRIATSPAGSAAGALLASTAEAHLKLAGVTLLLDPRSLVALGGVSASGTIPLPIPGDRSLVGNPVFIQSAHLDAGAPQGLAASDGLRLSVIR